jgi:phage terminase small subunit
MEIAKPSPPPASLTSPAAREKWEELVSIVPDKPQFRDCLAMACQMWAGYIEAGEAIERDGLVIYHASRANPDVSAMKPGVNPVAKFQLLYWDRYLTAIRQMGLTPHAEGRVLSKAGAAPSKLKAFLRKTA